MTTSFTASRKQLIRIRLEPRWPRPIPCPSNQENQPSVRLRLTLPNFSVSEEALLEKDFDRIFVLRQQEAEDYYNTVIPAGLSSDAKQVMRQGFAGLLWSKQFYHYVVRDWLEGDEGEPTPPPERYQWP